MKADEQNCDATSEGAKRVGKQEVETDTIPSTSVAQVPASLTEGTDNIELRKSQKMQTQQENKKWKQIPHHQLWSLKVLQNQ
jgi:hypothetical protein